MGAGDWHSTPGRHDGVRAQGQEPGATVFVAGTHGNEIAGIVAAIVLVEHSRVEKGRLIVMPHANNSAITDVDPERPGPTFRTRPMALAEVPLRFRRTRPRAGRARSDDVQPPQLEGDETLQGTEARNLNRVVPGRGRGER